MVLLEFETSVLKPFILYLLLVTGEFRMSILKWTFAAFFELMVRAFLEIKFAILTILCLTMIFFFANSGTDNVQV